MPDNELIDAYNKANDEALANNSDSSTDDPNSNQQNANNQTQGAKKPVILGCDSNNENDSQVQDIVYQALTAAGYQTTKLEIGPNPFADYSYTEEGKGKFGVYLMAASLISYLDATDANFDFNVLGIRGDVTDWDDNAFNSRGVPQDHDGNYSHPRYDECAGKTYPQLNEMFKDRCIAVGGQDPQVLAQRIVEALGGQYSGLATTGESGGGAQIKDKTFEDCIRRICAATDSVFLVENNAAVLFPYTDWMAFTLRHKLQQIKAKDIDPELYEIDYHTDGFYNKVTVVWGADEEEDKEKTEEEKKKEEEELEKRGNVTTVKKTMPTGGTQMSEQYDPLVEIYGELEKKVTTNFPNEETAHFVMNALLIQYIRDFNNSCRARVINNQKFLGGTFYAVEDPNTNESEMFYLNSYTMFKEKDQPLVSDMEFKYGPEGAEELLDYQVYGGGGGGSQTQSVGSSTEDEIWKHAANFCHFWSCPELQEEESETTDPQTAEDYVNKKEKEGKTKIGFSCYGMSSWLYFQFNNKANIPCRVIGNDGHHVVEIYKNNSWYKPVEEYRQLDEGFRYDDFCKGDAPVLLDAPNSPAGNSTNANPSGNTADQNQTNNETSTK